MASLYKDEKGYRLKITIGEQSKVITLGKLKGKAPAKTAERCKSEVETILCCNAGGNTYPPETSRWLSEIDDTLHGKLVRAGLLTERQRRTLGQWIKQFENVRQGTVKTRTVAVFKVIEKRMVEFFGIDTPLQKITAEQAVGYQK